MLTPSIYLICVITLHGIGIVQVIYNKNADVILTIVYTAVYKDYLQQ